MSDVNSCLTLIHARPSSRLFLEQNYLCIFSLARMAARPVPLNMTTLTLSAEHYK
jgi:hypothetical protein